MPTVDNLVAYPPAFMKGEDLFFIPNEKQIDGKTLKLNLLYIEDDEELAFENQGEIGHNYNKKDKVVGAYYHYTLEIERCDLEYAEKLFAFLNSPGEKLKFFPSTASKWGTECFVQRIGYRRVQGFMQFTLKVLGTECKKTRPGIKLNKTLYGEGNYGEGIYGR